MVGVEAEFSAHRLKVGFLQRLLHGYLVGQVAVGRGDCRCDQIHRIVGLRTKNDGRNPGYFS